MSDGWATAPLSDVTVLIKRGRAPKYAEDGALVISQKCIQSYNSFSTALARRTDVESKPVPDWAWLQETDILVNSTGRGTLGRAAYVGHLSEKATADSHVTIVRPNPTEVVPLFLALVLSVRTLEIESLQSGSTSQTELSPSALGTLHVPLPPLAVQRRIVDVMAHLDAHIANLRAERGTARNVLVAIAADWLSRSDIEPIPLGDVTHMYQPKTLSKSALVNSGQYPVFGANGLIGYHDEFNHAEEQVAVTCRGATCGRVNWTPANCWITGNAMVVRPFDEGVLDRRFLYWALQYLTDLAVSVSGSAQPQITRASLSPVRLPIPALSEQGRLTRVLDGLWSHGLRLEYEQETLAGLRDALLLGLLDGSVSVDDGLDALLAGAA